MPSIAIFDTETTSLNKPYCYNIGYAIFDLDSWTMLTSRDYVIEQVWHNLPLFNTAYYADKRPIYVSAMKGKKAKLRKFGTVTQKMLHDFEAFDVVAAMAYNSPFDVNVFDFNCDWFKVVNPFETVAVNDIRGYAHNFICNTDEYKQFCEDQKRFSDAGNYSTTAESVFQFVSGNHDFTEDHTALSDSLIEAEILHECIKRGAKIGEDYPVMKTIPRIVSKPLLIKINGKEVYKGSYTSVYKRDKEGKYYFKGCERE